jgi:nucleotide-binding universal stress UspA family protein
MAQADATRGPILVAVDLGEQSPLTLGWAADLARFTNRALTVLLVAHDPDDHPGTYASQDGGVESITTIAERRLHDFVGEHSEVLLDLDVELEVVGGLPASRIVEVAENVGASHIVVGAHGHSGWMDRVVGSQADRIIRHARVPVTVVKVPPEADDG